ncbi:MAG: Lrp/AsnC family transcriptional regulator [Alistipes finegoldii]
MPKTSLDAIDRKILKYLIKNARMPFLEIARECGISGAAIHQRIRKLDDSGVILGSRLIVDPKMMGFDVCAHISITLKDPQPAQANRGTDSRRFPKSWRRTSSPVRAISS